MNWMMKLAMQNKAFRESYQKRPGSEEEKILVSMFNKDKAEVKPEELNDIEIGLVMEWLSNQRFPTLESEDDE